MRYSTKRKLWGRGKLVAALRTAIYELNKALAADNQVAQMTALEATRKELQSAAEGMDVYGVDRTRIRRAIIREQKNIAQIMEQAKTIPVTIEEQAKAQVDRAKRKEGQKSKRR